MLQFILLLAIAGLVVAHLMKPTIRTTKGTKGTKGTNEGFYGSGGDTDTSYDSTYQAGGDFPANEPIDDPRDLPWIASWTPADKAARAGQNCNPSYTEIGPKGTMIITTSKSCEAGMPHTLVGDRIMIPDSVVLPALATTIDHELVHIHQRRSADAWATFYRRNWSFNLQSTPPAHMPAELVEARRSNPDTWVPSGGVGVGGPWSCWMNRYWPVPVYTDPKQPRLRDTITVWWDEWKREILKQAPEAWTQFFGSPTQNEHPHEIAAVMITDETGESGSTEAGRRLMAWWSSSGAL
jgi:hypothetical protein